MLSLADKLNLIQSDLIERYALNASIETIRRGLGDRAIRSFGISLLADQFALGQMNF